MSPYLSPIYSPKRSLLCQRTECFEETICVFWGDELSALRRRYVCFGETTRVFLGDEVSALRRRYVCFGETETHRKVLYIKDFYSRDL